MPGKRKKKQGAGRRKSRGGRPKSGPGAGGPTTTVSTSTGGFPSRMRVRLVYSQLNTLTITTTSVGVQTFRGNSVFDPDLTGSGGQPYNFDDFAIEYKRYRVRSCKIELQLLNGSATPRGSTTVLVPTNSSTTFTTIDDAMSAPHAKFVLMGGNSGHSQAKITMTRSTKQVLGEDWGDRFEALVSADPADPWFYQIVTRSNDGSTNEAVSLVSRLTYDVEFFDRNILTLDFLRGFLAEKDAAARERKAACPPQPPPGFDLGDGKEARDAPPTVGPGLLSPIGRSFPGTTSSTPAASSGPGLLEVGGRSPYAGWTLVPPSRTGVG